MKRLCYSIVCLLLMCTIALTAQAEEYVPNNGDDVCSHVFSSWSQVENGHTRACTICGLTELGGHAPSSEGTVTVPSTCTEKGVLTHVCGSCGASFQSAIPALGHNYTYQNLDTSSHKRICQNCNGEETMSHEWRSKGWDAAPTCQSEGIDAYDCACGATKKETLPKTDHPFTAWSGDELTHTRSCQYCGKTENGFHQWYGGTVVLAPTCKEPGVMGYGCTGCDMVLLEEIPVQTGHVYDNDCDSTCNSCGVTRNTSHKYSTTYSKNNMSHWYECTSCGSKKDTSPHIPGPAATANSDQTCNACDYVLRSRLDHTHSYQSKWSSNGEGHWYACTGCSMQKDFKAHTYDGACDENCNVCGYVNQSAHTYDGTWKTDENGHWSVCTTCKKESARKAHVPGPEATEEKPQLCTVCSYMLKPIQKHVHAGVGEWITDDANHWKQCECEELTDKAEHSWDEGVNNKDTTTTYTCSVCQMTKIEGEPQETIVTDPTAINETDPAFAAEPGPIFGVETEAGQETVKQKTGSTWIVIVFIFILVVLAGAVAALLLVLKPKKKKGKFSRKGT